jgi:hypothetical protein
MEALSEGQFRRFEKMASEYTHSTSFLLEQIHNFYFMQIVELQKDNSK